MYIYGGHSYICCFYTVKQSITSPAIWANARVNCHKPAKTGKNGSRLLVLYPYKIVLNPAAQFPVFWYLAKKKISVLIYLGKKNAQQAI